MGDKRAAICAVCAYADWKPTHRCKADGVLVMKLMSNVCQFSYDSEGNRTSSAFLTIYELIEGTRIAISYKDFVEKFDDNAAKRTG